MKKAFFILSTVLFFGILSSCSTNELTVKKNWIFTATVVTTTNGVAMPAAPSTTEEKDNLTEVEAEAARLAAEKAANDEISTDETYQALIQAAAANNITMKITVNVTKAIKP